ncbi:hypothetical protein JTB14_022771 [Gonioctena quinquepunctata]|nr:hypothetical protein JTB14_022771 [Gonioctena quinquepunctata]
MILGLILSISVALFHCILGQILIDGCEKFHDLLCHSSWIYWNERNRKCLLIILPNTAKSLKMSCFGLIDLNFYFILYVCIHNLVQYIPLI